MNFMFFVVMYINLWLIFVINKDMGDMLYYNDLLVGLVRIGKQFDVYI